jgi:hypothetical protein
MEQSPTLEADSRSAGKIIPRLLWVRKFVTVFTKACHWIPSWASWIQYKSYIFQIHFNIIFKMVSALRIHVCISHLTVTLHTTPISPFFLVKIFSSLRSLILTLSMQNCDTSVVIALGYGLDDRGSRVRFPARAGNFSLYHGVQTGSGAHPASYPMGTRGSFPGGKAVEAWSWPLTSI